MLFCNSVQIKTSIDCIDYRTAATNIHAKSSSAMAERQRELGDFKGVGHFEAKF